MSQRTVLENAAIFLIIGACWAALMWYSFPVEDTTHLTGLVIEKDANYLIIQVGPPLDGNVTADCYQCHLGSLVRIEGRYDCMVGDRFDAEVPIDNIKMEGKT
jgi:hypothetical protein